MSLDVTIKFKEPRVCNYVKEHPYSYNSYATQDTKEYDEKKDYWSANITHNLTKMASHIPINLDGTQVTLYKVCWTPEKIEVKTVKDILPLLIQGIHYMIDNRKGLEQYNPPNGWGSYNVFVKFMLNYKQACEDADPECIIEAYR